MAGEAPRPLPAAGRGCPGPGPAMAGGGPGAGPGAPAGPIGPGAAGLLITGEPLAGPSPVEVELSWLSERVKGLSLLMTPAAVLKPPLGRLISLPEIGSRMTPP